jgi:hypothetical protein
MIVVVNETLDLKYLIQSNSALLKREEKIEND